MNECDITKMYWAYSPSSSSSQSSSSSAAADMGADKAAATATMVPIVTSAASFVKPALAPKRVERAADVMAEATAARSDAAAEMAKVARPDAAGLLTAVDLSAVRWIGGWPCSEPARSSQPSAEASIWALMAAISVVNAVPSGMLEPLAEKAESHINPFSLRRSK